MYSEIREELLEDKRRLEARLGRISANRLRDSGPLDRNSTEQALELSNDEVVDQLDVSGREQLMQINSALERMEGGTYGECMECGKQIPEGRLKALPFAMRCVKCEEKRA